MIPFKFKATVTLALPVTATTILKRLGPGPLSKDTLLRLFFYKQFDFQLKDRTSLSNLAGLFSRTHLAGFQEVKANVGVPGYGIQAVLTEVLVDVFWCRLGQEAVYTLPNRKRREEEKNSEKINLKMLTLLSLKATFHSVPKGALILLEQAEVGMMSEITHGHIS